MNNPYLYEGWNKQFYYILAFTPDKVEDVTRKYTRKWKEIRTRRKYEKEVHHLIDSFNEFATSKHGTETASK